MKGRGFCNRTAVPTYITCPAAGVNVWTWGHNIQGKDVQCMYNTVLSRHKQ